MVRWSYSCLDSKYSLMTVLVFKQSLTRCEVQAPLCLVAQGTPSASLPFFTQKNPNRINKYVYLLATKSYSDL